MLALAVIVSALVPYFSWGEGEDPLPEKPAIVLDVSSHQGDINWSQVRARGIYHKLSEGEDFRDPAWTAQRRRSLREARIPWGLYHYLRPKRRPPAREAQWFIRQARENGGWGKLLPAIDIEESELSPRATGNYLAGMIRTMRKNGVSHMMLYASPSWWRSNVLLTRQLRQQLRYLRPWIAHWGVSEPDLLQGMRGWHLHQYTASGRMPGIQGPVDMNRFRNWRALLRKNGS